MKLVKILGLCLLLVLFASLASATGDVTQVISENAPSTQVFGYATSNSQKIAQNFSVNGTGNYNLDSFVQYIRKQGTPSDNWFVSIQTDNGGEPSGVLADVDANESVSNSVLSSSLTSVEVNFTGDVTLTRGTVYWVVYERSGSLSTSDYYVIGRDTSDASYPGYEFKIFRSSPLEWGYFGAAANNLLTLNFTYTLPTPKFQITLTSKPDNTSISSFNASFPGDYFYSTTGGFIELDSYGVLEDHSGNGNDGTLNNYNTYTATLNNGAVVNSTTGIYTFDGELDYINIGTASGVLGSNLSEVTYSFWVYYDGDTNDRQMIYSNMNAGGNKGSQIGVNDNTNDVRLWFNTASGGINPTTTYDIPTQTWTHLALTYSSGLLILYADGIPVQNWTSLTGVHVFDTSSFDIGNWIPSTDYFNGSIRNYRVYDKELNNTQISSDMDSSVPIARSVVAYDLPASNYTSGTSLYDNNYLVHNPEYNYSNGYGFNGVNQTITATLPDTNYQSICGWVRPNTLSGIKVSVSDGSNWWVGTNAGNFYINGASIATDTNWHHFCLINDTTDRAYYDGVLVSSGSLATKATSLRLGGNFAGSFYSDSDISDVRVYNKSLSVGEVNDIYTNGSRYADNLVLQLNGYAFHDEERNYSVTLQSNNHFPVAHPSALLTNTYDLWRYPQITLTNDWNNTAINNFTATINGTDYNTLTGTLSVPYNTTENVLLQSPSYLNVTQTNNFTNTGDYDEVTGQNIVNFDSVQIITGNSLTSNYTVFYNGSNQSITTGSYIDNGVYNFTSSIDGYYNQTQETSLTGLLTQTINFTDMYNHIMNASVYYFRNNTLVPNFTLETAYGYIVNSTTGSVLIQGLKSVSYLLNITSDVMASITNYVINTSTPALEYINITAFNFNTVYIEIRDADTKNLINNRNFTLDLFSDTNSRNYTTGTGNITLSLLEPENYLLKYNGTDYPQRQYQFTLTNDTSQQITLYSQINTKSTYSLVQVSVVDEVGQPLENVIVTAQRRYVDNNAYENQEISTTNSDGIVVQSLTLNDEYYRFQVTQEDGTVIKITDPNILTASSIVIQAFIGANVDRVFEEYDDISYTYSYNNVSRVITLDYVNPTNIGQTLCLYLNSVSAIDNTRINSTCSTSSSGQLTMNVPNSSSVVYYAKIVIVDSDGFEYLLTEDYIDEEQDSELGITGWVYQLLITALLIGVGLSMRSIPVMSVLTGLSLVIGRALQLHFMSIENYAIILIISIIIAIFTSRERI